MTFNSHNIVSGQSGPFVLINVCMYVCMYEKEGSPNFVHYITIV